MLGDVDSKSYSCLEKQEKASFPILKNELLLRAYFNQLVNFQKSVRKMIRSKLNEYNEWGHSNLSDEPPKKDEILELIHLVENNEQRVFRAWDRFVADGALYSYIVPFFCFSLCSCWLGHQNTFRK